MSSEQCGTVKQEQEEISRNHVQTFISLSVCNAHLSIFSQGASKLSQFHLFSVYKSIFLHFLDGEKKAFNPWRTGPSGDLFIIYEMCFLHLKILSYGSV